MPLSLKSLNLISISPRFSLTGQGDGEVTHIQGNHLS